MEVVGRRPGVVIVLAASIMRQELPAKTSLVIKRWVCREKSGPASAGRLPGYIPAAFGIAVSDVTAEEADVVDVTVSSRAMPRWASLAGLVYVVLFVIGSLLMFDGPSGDDPPAKFKAFYGDAGHRDRINVGWVLAGLGRSRSCGSSALFGSTCGRSMPVAFGRA